MKETFYFSHDYYSRSDPKLLKLQMKHGLEGIGAYWCIIEMLYEECGFLSVNEYERITYELRTKYELVQSVIQDFDLFKIDAEKFWSESAINRLNERANKSDKARQSINKRWEKYERNTNVIRTNTKRNTIKERKGKEKKVIKERETPDEFYKKQLELSGNDANYQKYIDVLYGKTTGIKLDGVLGLEYQLTYEKFLELLPKCKAKKKSLIQYTLDLENKGYYKKVKSIYLTFNNWLSREEI